MSPSRSRSGGRAVWITDNRYRRSSRKPPRRHHAPQVPVRRGDQADRDLLLFGAADPGERLGLEHAEHPGLGGQRHLADLVEEQGAAVGPGKHALVLGDGPGERPFFVAEQLALEQLLGDRRAVDRDERPGRARRQIVDEARRELLARPALAVQQHRRRARGHALDEHLQLAHRGRAPDHSRHLPRPGAPAPSLGGHGELDPLGRRGAQRRHEVRGADQQVQRVLFVRAGRGLGDPPVDVEHQVLRRGRHRADGAAHLHRAPIGEVGLGQHVAHQERSLLGERPIEQHLGDRQVRPLPVRRGGEHVAAVGRHEQGSRRGQRLDRPRGGLAIDRLQRAAARESVSQGRQRRHPRRHRGGLVDPRVHLDRARPQRLGRRVPFGNPSVTLSPGVRLRSAGWCCPA